MPDKAIPNPIGAYGQGLGSQGGQAQAFPMRNSSTSVVINQGDLVFFDVTTAADPIPTVQQGGAGSNLLVGGTAGNNSIAGGTGHATLYGAGNNDVLLAQGSAGQVLHAGKGNETLNASASSGADTLYGGTGHTTITGGAGSDVFAFIKGQSGGTDLIVNFNSAEKIALQGYGAGEAAHAFATSTVASGATLVTLTDGTQITLASFTNLKLSNFS